MTLIGDIIDWCAEKLGNNGNGLADDREIEMEDMGAIRYRKEKQPLQAEIDEASKEKPDIGGADVIVTFARAEQQAADKDWDAATDTLHDAHRKAQLVLKRKPFLRAKVDNEPKIKAAMKIKMINTTSNEAYGKEIEAKWKEILKQGADDNQIANATRGITELVQLIDGTLGPALKEARGANAKKLEDLKGQLDQAKGNPKLLRQISENIFQNTAEAEGLGVDAGENARKEFTEEKGSPWTAKNCEDTFVAYDWFALKKCRKDRQIKLAGKDRPFSDDDMWKLVQYRGKVVNDVIDKLRQKYPTLIASASGSEDIESDIDIAFATPNSGDDVKAAKEFNVAIKKRFKKPPGRVFDVNIYPRDYRALRGDSFKPGYNVDKIEDVGIDEPESEESAKLSKIDQDVATLLKQRRFLDEDQFNDMLDELLSKAPDKETRDRIEMQYEEGEDIYLLTSIEKIEKIRGEVKLNESTDKHAAELKKMLAELDGLKDKPGKDALVKTQRLVPRILNLFEEAFPDETMDVTDALYLDKMGSLREDQEEIRTLKQPGDPHEHHKDKQCDEVHQGQEHEEWLMERLNGLEVKVKKDMFTNIIFANEAIMSQGALNHVVGALQAKTDDEKQAAVKKLSASDLMQSVNEQVADLFKEIKHFEGVVDEAEEGAQGAKGKETAKNQATGEGYVHASKYFFRLLNAANFLNLKYPQDKYPTIHAPYAAVNNKDLKELEDRINNVLLKLRKSAVIPPEVKGEVGAFEFQEIFPQVKDIASFRTLISKFAIELNSRIRSLDEFKQEQKMASEQEKEAEKGYFKAATPQPPKKEKATAGAK